MKFIKFTVWCLWWMTVNLTGGNCNTVYYYLSALSKTKLITRYLFWGEKNKAFIKQIIMLKQWDWTRGCFEIL